MDRTLKGDRWGRAERLRAEVHEAQLELARLRDLTADPSCDLRVVALETTSLVKRIVKLRTAVDDVGQRC